MKRNDESDAIKLKKAQSKRTLREDGVWMYHDKVDPEDVDGSPEYFDEIATDLIDPEKYFSAPLTSGIGTKFCMLLGDPLKGHYKADFEVDGLVKKTSEAGVVSHKLLWTRLSEWRVVDVTQRFKSTVRGEDRKPAVKKVA